MATLQEKINAVENAEDAIDLYAECNDMAKALKDAKKKMVAIVGKHLDDKGLDKDFIGNATIGITNPTSKVVVNEELWGEKIKHDLDLLKLEIERDGLRSEFLEDATPAPRTYITLGRR